MSEGKLNIEPEISPDVFRNFQRLCEERKAESVRKQPVLEARNVVKRYDDQTAIPDLNFVIDDIEGKSEIITILGPSGCGKSTILNMVAGLLPPTSGEFLTFGKPIEGPGVDRGMIFQRYSSFPFLTVLDNIAYPLVHVLKKPWKEAREVAKHWVDKMYLTGAEKKFPAQLSGGMQQRLAIARTLSARAPIILMDEPFGALDRKIRWEMQDLIAEIAFFQPEHEFTIMLVTHDIPEALYLGDRVWIIHQGRIIRTEFCERPSEPARQAQSRPHFLELVSFFNAQIDQLVIAQEG
jgi:NitT/TauT family transport system ATP-binding protein